MPVPVPNDSPHNGRILEYSAPVPERLDGEAFPLAGNQAQLDMFAKILTENGLRFLLFNKNHPTERICPACRIRYTAPQGPRLSRVEEEQQLSGICSSQCFIRLNGPNGYDINGWQGQAAEATLVDPEAGIVVNIPANSGN